MQVPHPEPRGRGLPVQFAATSLFAPQPYRSLCPQVLGFTLIILYTSSVSVTLWRIQHGMPQAPEFLIHPTVWLTTMVRTSPGLLARSWLAASPASVEGVG